jgi:hypothetical protein
MRRGVLRVFARFLDNSDSAANAKIAARLGEPGGIPSPTGR